MVQDKMGENRLVYSTQTGRIQNKEQTKPSIKTDGVVRIRRETKGRKGKGMTTVSGLDAPEKELKELCSRLKKMCGTGGALKNGIIEIQGDNRDKIKVTLEQLGHNVKLAGG
jgi:translation initiation factor 1